MIPLSERRSDVNRTGATSMGRTKMSCTMGMERRPKTVVALVTTAMLLKMYAVSSIRSCRHANPNLPFQNTGQLKALANQRSKDEKISKLLNSIRVYLPNLNREGGGRTSDYLVHPTALAHLRRRFNHICSSLLRNDSLADMSDRSILYFELLEWLEVFIRLSSSFVIFDLTCCGRPSPITKRWLA